MIEQAIILAGGAGTRLQATEPNLHKVLVPVGGRPLIAHLFDLLVRHGVRNVLVTVGHRAKQVIDFVGDGSAWGAHVGWVKEDQPLGTAGALLLARQNLRSDFFVLYGDVLADLDLGRLAAFHEAKHSAATLVAHPSTHAHDSDLLDVDEQDRVTAFLPAAGRVPGDYRNLASAACYALSNSVVEHICPGSTQDFVRDLFPRVLGAGLGLYAYRTAEYLRDMGTPERLAGVRRDWETGKVRRVSWSSPIPTVFLDRDGVLNHEVNELVRPEQLELIPGAAQAVRRINDAGQFCVVVTNQPMLAKGTLSPATLEQIHGRLEALVSEAGGYFDAVEHCPHHPERGFAGERPELKGACSCRKPETGMLIRANTKLPIDWSRSVLVGDSWRDVGAGRKANVPVYGVRTGAGSKARTLAEQPDLLFANIGEVVRFLFDPLPALSSIVSQVRTLLQRKAAPIRVCIDGPPLSGKTVFSHALVRALQQSSVRCAHVRFDLWRSAGPLACCETYYRIDELTRSVDELVTCGLTQLRPWLTYSQQLDELPLMVSVADAEVLVLDGTFSALVTSHLASADVVHFQDATDAALLDRFSSLGRWRGQSSTEIKTLALSWFLPLAERARAALTPNPVKPRQVPYAEVLP